MKPGPKIINPEIRFWKKVDVYSNLNGCWIWNSSLNQKGYGQFYVNDKHRPISAHIFSFELIRRESTRWFRIGSSM